MSQVRLTSEAVDALMLDCLFRDEEEMLDPIYAEGILNTYAFHKDRLTSHRDEIIQLLAQLPDTFRADKGGGWSFLNACEDRHGILWTGLHLVMERLLCLGIGIGAAKWLPDRRMWSALPGGMPYVVLTLPLTETIGENHTN